MLPLSSVLLERRKQMMLVVFPTLVLAAQLLAASAEAAMLEAIPFQAISARRQYKTADQPDIASHNWHS